MSPLFIAGVDVVGRKDEKGSISLTCHSPPLRARAGSMRARCWTAVESRSDRRQRYLESPSWVSREGRVGTTWWYPEDGEDLVRARGAAGGKERGDVDGDAVKKGREKASKMVYGKVQGDGG